MGSLEGVPFCLFEDGWFPFGFHFEQPKGVSPRKDTILPTGVPLVYFSKPSMGAR